MSYYYSLYPKRKTQGEIKAMAQKNIKPGYMPIIIEGSKIATSWWGISWCNNIDRYADAYNRLSRGRSYAKSGCVIDLRIDGGEIRAKVQGSVKKPYEVTVHIKPIAKENLDHIMEIAGGSLESLEDLEHGKFPKEFKELFTAEGKGLFPTMKEISFSCSCPDSARLCKHIAAVLYAIGRRLDDNPLLFLSMRNIDVKDFSERVIKKEVERLFKSSDGKIDKEALISDDEAIALFGYDKFDEKIDEKIDLKKIFGV